MTWRLARALEQLRAQVNQKWPQRSKESDGSIGDEHHSARLSDHNPDGAGVVHAIDITHDPKGGFDSYAFADMLLKRQDHRLKYVISNRRIGSGPAGPAPGVWRPYTGINPHDHHCHVSVMSGQLADDMSAWSIDGGGGAVPSGRSGLRAASSHPAPRRHRRARPDAPGPPERPWGLAEGRWRLRPRHPGGAGCLPEVHRAGRRWHLRPDVLASSRLIYRA
ncbi:hypothetical protein ACVJMY_002935 [Bradyrhizobium diazoefficiens]